MKRAKMRKMKKIEKKLTINFNKTLKLFYLSLENSFLTVCKMQKNINKSQIIKESYIFFSENAQFFSYFRSMLQIYQKKNYGQSHKMDYMLFVWVIKSIFQQKAI